MTFRTFISMGRYAPYVWSSYALAVAVLTWNDWSARRKLEQALALTRRRLQAKLEQ